MIPLLSKIAAGGLSAGVFLVWWPEHVHGEGLPQLVLRGLAWTLAFELLVLAFRPLERRIASVAERRRSARRTAVLRERLGQAPETARTGGAVALACLGIAGPAVLLADAPHRLTPTDESPKVVRQVIVKRPVVRREVVVRPAAAPRPPAPGTPAPPAAQRSLPRTWAPPSRAVATPARRTATVPERTTAPARPRRPPTRTSEPARMTTPPRTAAAPAPAPATQQPPAVLPAPAAPAAAVPAP